MCNLKPGDEVVCVDDAQYGANSIAYTFLAVGKSYLIDGYDAPTSQGIPLVFLGGVDAEKSPCERASFRWTRFRKVIRRDLSAGLETAATDTDRWDKPIKAPAPLHPVASVDALFRRIMAGGDR